MRHIWSPTDFLIFTVISIVSATKESAAASPVSIVQVILLSVAVDRHVFHAFGLNNLLIGMVSSATITNVLPEKELGRF